MAKILVIYHTFSGNTEQMANAIAEGAARAKGDETYRIERQLSFHGDGEAYERLRYSTDIKLGLTRSVFQDLIYIDEGIPEDHQLDIDAGLSAGERMMEYLEDQVERNVDRDIRMLVLDSALDRLRARSTDGYL